MKKTLSLILALLMTLSCASAIFADTAITDTAAAATTSAYADAIEFLVDQDIMKGYDNGELGAEDAVQRYQMALFTGRILTGWVNDKAWEDGPENSSKFTDLAGTAAEAYYGALSYVSQKGVIEGYGNGKFGPEDEVKYQDVLTMAVRALGYKTLEYPWGYIEKAINLGLTEGITGVAYTAPAKRGEVAQVIYNTLFAETKEGDTLALRSFGVEFGWETVIITATDRAVYAAGDKTVDKGYTGFRILNADGTLDDEVYVVTSKALGFADDHEDEVALGRPYKVFFEIDANSDLVKVNKYVELYDAENDVWNAGRTDDAGENVGTYAIETFLKGYTLVTKYAQFNISSNIASDFDATYDKKDIIVKGGFGEGLYYEFTSENQKYAFNWESGDILVKVGVDEDGNAIYETEWYWNAKAERYFAVKTAAGVDGIEQVIGIHYMTEADAAALRADYEAAFVVAKTKAEMTTLSKVSAPAYAMLETYDLNEDGTADYALYEEFKFGYMYETTIECTHDNVKSAKKAIAVNNVNSLAEAVYALNNNVEDYEFVSEAFKVTLDSACADCGTAWINPDYAPDAKLLGNWGGYVVYNYNEVTGEIKVVKTIQDEAKKTDEDSYIATGLIVSYDMGKKTVTVQKDDGTLQTLEMGYDALLGAGYTWLGKENKAAEKAYADYFYNDLYNQYVKYVLVDGKLVKIDVEGAKDYTEALIVKEFAGISTDGYILVDAYNLANLKLERFRIATFDGYKQGDLFYNYKLTQDELKAMFATGTIYKIDSYIPATKSYNVHVAGAYNETKSEAKRSKEDND